MSVDQRHDRVRFGPAVHQIADLHHGQVGRNRPVAPVGHPQPGQLGAQRGEVSAHVTEHRHPRSGHG